jgi:hypothetical protein
MPVQNEYFKAPGKKYMADFRCKITGRLDETEDGRRFQL